MYAILVIIGTFVLIFTYLKKIFKFLNYLERIIRRYLNKNVDKKIDVTKYQPVSYAECIVIYERIKSNLIEKGYENSLLIKNCENLQDKLPNLFEIADKSCCGQIKANGYFSIAKLIFKILELLDRELTSKMSEKKFKQEFDYFTKMSALIIRMMEILLLISKDTNLDDEEAKKRLDDELLNNYPEFHRNLKVYKQIMVKKRSTKSIDSVDVLKSSNCDQCDDDILINNNSINNSFTDTCCDQEFNSLPLFTPHLSTIFECINEGINEPNLPNKHLIFGKHFSFWLDKNLRNFFELYTFILPFFRVRFYRYFQLIFSSDYRTKTLNYISTFPTIFFPFWLWDLLDTKIGLLFLDFKTRHTNTKSKELFIPSQNSILINQSPYERLTINDIDEIRFKRNQKIRCIYIKPKKVDIENSSKLILNFHGGGFLSQSSDSHEIYLRDWVNSYKIPILAVDYKVKECFPNGLKDCFDVYLWLRMAPEEEIRTKLGFYPKKIILEGDSAGGNLGFGIVLALNDLRTDYKNKLNLQIQMPDGIVCIYTPFLLNLSISPSRVLSVLDALVPFGLQLIIIKAISGLMPGLKKNTRFQVLKTFLFPSSDPAPWFACNQDELKKSVNSLSQMITSPYLNLLFYDKFDSLTDVPLQLISAEFCSFLDESVTIAKIWKGPTKIDVLPSIGHGFLNLNFLGGSVSDSTMFCGQKIREMFK